MNLCWLFLITLCGIIYSADPSSLLTKISTTHDLQQQVRLPFVQKRTLPLWDETITTPGFIEIDKAQQALRWQYGENVVMIISHGTLRRWVDGIEEKIKAEQTLGMKEQFEAMLTGDWSNLQQIFSLSVDENNPLRLVCTPKDADLLEYVTSLSITFRPEVFTPEVMTMTLPDGAQSSHHFATPEFDVTFAEGRFAKP